MKGCIDGCFTIIGLFFMIGLAAVLLSNPLFWVLGGLVLIGFFLVAASKET